MDIGRRDKNLQPWNPLEPWRPRPTPIYPGSGDVLLRILEKLEGIEKRLTSIEEKLDRIERKIMGAR